MSKKNVKKLVKQNLELCEAVKQLADQVQKQGQTSSNCQIFSDGEKKDVFENPELAELEFLSKKAQEENDEEQLAVIALRQKVNSLESQLSANNKKIKELKRELEKTQKKVMCDTQKQIQGFEKAQKKVLDTQNKKIADIKRKEKRLTRNFIKVCRFLFCDVRVDSLRDVETTLRRVQKLNHIDENVLALTKGGKRYE